MAQEGFYSSLKETGILKEEYENFLKELKKQKKFWNERCSERV